MSRLVDASDCLAGSECKFVEGELVRITRAAKKYEGTDQAVMWGEGAVPEIIEVPWDSVGIVTGGARWVDCGEPEGARGELLMRVLFPHGSGLWWPENFEPVRKLR